MICSEEEANKYIEKLLIEVAGDYPLPQVEAPVMRERCVYFAPLRQAMAFKVGFSIEPKQRMEHLSSCDTNHVFLPEKIMIIRASHDFERRLHKVFHEYRFTLDKSFRMSSGRTECYPIEVFDEIIDYAKKKSGSEAELLYSDDDLDRVQKTTCG